MSEKGASNLSKAIFSRNNFKLYQAISSNDCFAFLFQYLGGLEGIKSQVDLTLTNYLIIIVAMLIVMFVVARWIIKDFIPMYIWKAPT